MAQYWSFGSEIFANRLVARDARSGETTWELGADPTHALYGAAFLDVPAAIGDMLVVPYQRRDELLLAMLEPVSGRLVERFVVHGSPTSFTPLGGQCFVLVEHPVVYICTGNGVAAALRLRSSPTRGAPALTWEWATHYAEPEPIDSVATWWVADDEHDSWPSERPILTDELLILPPYDSDELVALNRFDGRERWRVPWSETEILVGPLPGGFVTAGDRVRCRESATGRTFHWQSLPIELTGRPALLGGDVVVPTPDGLLVLDGATGKVVADQWQPHDTQPASNREASANLLAATDALFAVGPDMVQKYPSPAVRSLYSKAGSEPVTAARDRYILAMLDALEGELESACDRLRDLVPDDPGLRAARDRLGTSVLLALADRAPNDAERLARLREAAAAGAGTRAGALLGDVLEQSGFPEEALAHFKEILLSAPADHISPGPVAGYRVADWLYAAGRVDSLLAGMSPGDRQAFVENLVTDAIASGRPSRMMRVYPLVIDAQQRERLGQALVLWQPADANDPETGTLRPELLARYLPDGGAGRAEVPARDTLNGTAAGVFTSDLQRRWVAEDHELILPRGEGGPPDTLPLRHLVNQRISLVTTATGRVRTSTVDGVTGGRGVAESLADSAQHALFSNTDIYSPIPGAWPAIRHRDLAALPTVGGLIAFGLGAEPGGGQRLWEYAIPQWHADQAGFARHAVAGPDGVYLFAQPGRLIHVGWSDGLLRWERDLPGISCRHLALAAGMLVLTDDEGRAYTLDPALGHPLCSVTAFQDVPAESAVVGDLVLRWTDEVLRGVDPRTLETLWSRSTGAIGAQHVVTGREWFAYQSRVSGIWHLLDVRNNEPLPVNLPHDVGAVEVVVATEGQLLVVSNATGMAEAPNTVYELSAYDPRDGRQLWSRRQVSATSPNASQLCGHPAYIVILRWSDGQPALELIDRHTGDTVTPTGWMSEPGRDLLPLGEYFGPGDASRGRFVLVTSDSIIVQALGRVIAFGSAAPGPP